MVKKIKSKITLEMSGDERKILLGILGNTTGDFISEVARVEDIPRGDVETLVHAMLKELKEDE